MRVATLKAMPLLFVANWRLDYEGAPLRDISVNNVEFYLVLIRLNAIVLLGSVVEHNLDLATKRAAILHLGMFIADM